MNGEIMADNLRLALINLECTCNDIPPFGMEEHEIIQIAIVVCDISAEHLTLGGSLELNVKPVAHPTLTDFCIRLTDIKQVTIDQSELLIDLLPELQDWMLEHSVNCWGSWGSFYRSQFIIESRIKELTNPLASIQHVDIRRLFAHKFGYQVDIARALSIRGLAFEGQLNVGMDKIKNIARLLYREEILRNAILKMIKHT